MESRNGLPLVRGETFLITGTHFLCCRPPQRLQWKPVEDVPPGHAAQELDSGLRDRKCVRSCGNGHANREYELVYLLASS
jgi:hypothetical protein